MSLSRAKEYLFTGDRIMPDVAVQLGLASRVVPHDELMAEALKLAHRFAAQPAHALRSTKQALNMHLTRAMAGILEFALAQEYIAFDNPEHQAIVHKFTGK
jgi:enoyl-CoA hydratase